MRTKRIILPTFLLAYTLIQCTPIGASVDKLVAGDTMQRQTDGMMMVFVPAGEFTMGIDYLGVRSALAFCKKYVLTPGPGWCVGPSFADEMPAHFVTLDAFWIDRTEVTNQQYEACVNAQACSPPAESGSFTRESYFGDSLYAEFPVIWVTHEQAAVYCSWAGARLPTEAEWEYVARGPENRTFPWGETFEPAFANYCDASCAAGMSDPSFEDGYPETAPVGSFPAGVSWCGALDMAGNVREWVADWFTYYSAEPQFNPVGPSEGETHSPRGGCWLDTPEKLRGSHRGQATPDYSRHKVGFRCAMDLDQALY